MMGLSQNIDVQPVFRALADPTRRDILMLLSEKDMSIGEVCDHFDVTRAAIKKHLNILKEGELISVQVRGRECINKLESQRLKSASEWIGYFDQFWNKRLDKLKRAVVREQAKNSSTTSKGK